MTTLDDRLRSIEPDGPDIDVDEALGRVHKRHRRSQRSRFTALGVACLVLLLAGGVTLGARDDSETGLATDDSSGRGSIEDIIGVEWRFDRIEFSDGRESIDLREKETSLRFDESTFDGRICNRFEGAWSVQGSALMTGHSEWTVAACLDEAVASGENAFVELLSSSPISWVASPNSLELSAGGVTAYLARTTPTSAGDDTGPFIEDLIGVEWTFDRIEFSDGRETIDLTGEVTSLKIAQDRIHGSMCNSWGGDLHTSEGIIVVPDFTATQMACGGTIGDGEQAFFELLSAGPIAWTRADDTLELSAGAVTAYLSVRGWPFPPDIEPLADIAVQKAPAAVQPHPARPQHIIGTRRVHETPEIVIMVRSTPDQDFETVTSPWSAILQPVGLTWSESYVATWLPPGTAKAWVVLASGGAEVDLTLTTVDGVGIAGFAALPEPNGVIVAFDDAGNEIGRSEPFDIG